MLDFPVIAHELVIPILRTGRVAEELELSPEDKAALDRA